MVRGTRGPGQSKKVWSSSKSSEEWGVFVCGRFWGLLGGGKGVRREGGERTGFFRGGGGKIVLVVIGRGGQMGYPRKGGLHQ